MESLNSLLETFRERIRNPLVGAFIISWVVFNFRFIIIVFSDVSLQTKFTMLDSMYTDSMVPWFSCFFERQLLFPALSAIVATAAFPFISHPFLKANLKGRRLLNDLQKSLLSKYIVTGEEHTEVLTALETAKVEHMEERSKAKKEVEAAESAAQEKTQELMKAQHRVNELEEELGELTKKHDLATILAMTQNMDTPERLQKFITSQNWRLYFNPKGKHSKLITFRDDGTVDNENESGSRNESSWKVISRHSFEFYDVEGKVFSRFRLADRDVFVHTADDDLQNSPKYPDQFLIASLPNVEYSTTAKLLQSGLEDGRDIRPLVSHLRDVSRLQYLSSTSVDSADSEGIK